MKKTLLCFSMLGIFVLAACTTNHPNTPMAGNYIPIPAFKIKKMYPLSYQYSASKVGCSEIDFLKKFVGKSVRTDEGSIRVDNIIEIHKDVYSSQTSVFGIHADEQFECSFWGLGVEYEK